MSQTCIASPMLSTGADGVVVEARRAGDRVRKFWACVQSGGWWRRRVERRRGKSERVCQRGDGPEILEPIEETLNEIAFAVEGEIPCAELFGSIWMG